MLSSFDRVQCEMSAKLFLYANKCGYGSEKFTKMLMKSKLGDYLYSKNCVETWLGYTYVMSLIRDEVGIPPKGMTYDDNIMEWIGYVYRYWSLTTTDTGNKIYKLAPFKLMVGGYPGWHCIAISLVIDDIKTYNKQLIKN